MSLRHEKISLKNSELWKKSGPVLNLASIHPITAALPSITWALARTDRASVATATCINIFEHRSFHLMNQTRMLARYRWQSWHSASSPAKYMCMRGGRGFAEWFAAVEREADNVARHHVMKASLYSCSHKRSNKKSADFGTSASVGVVWSNSLSDIIKGDRWLGRFMQCVLCLQKVVCEHVRDRRATTQISTCQNLSSCWKFSM